MYMCSFRGLPPLPYETMVMANCVSCGVTIIGHLYAVYVCNSKQGNSNGGTQLISKKKDILLDSNLPAHVQYLGWELHVHILYVLSMCTSCPDLHVSALLSIRLLFCAQKIDVVHDYIFMCVTLNR